MTTELIAQIIGFIAFGFGIVSFLQKNDTRLKILLSVQALTLGAHFYLLGAYTGAAAVTITSVRNLLSIYPWGRKFAPIFYISTLVFGYLTYDEPIDSFPIIAGLIGTTALFYLSGIKMRIAFIFGSTLWLTHNIYVGSIGPSLMELMMLCIAIYRVYCLHVEDKKTIGNDQALTP